MKRIIEIYNIFSTHKVTSSQLASSVGKSTAPVFAAVMGSNPVQAEFFFQVLFSHLPKLLS